MKHMLIRAAFAVLTLLVLSVPLSAQVTPKAEVFGGFSLISPGDNHLYGWQASVAGHLNPSFSLVGDIGAGYRTLTVGSLSVDASSYTFVGGPRWNFRGQKVTGFAHVMAGGTNVRGSVSGIGGTVNAFTLATGGGVDVNAGDRIRVRVLQFDLLTNFTSGASGHDARFGFGLVIPFGRQ
jgi:hypothetical protein